MNNSNIIMYTTEDGLTKIETTFEDDTIWLSLDQMTELFNEIEVLSESMSATFSKRGN